MQKKKNTKNIIKESDSQDISELTYSVLSINENPDLNVNIIHEDGRSYYSIAQSYVKNFFHSKRYNWCVILFVSITLIILIDFFFYKLQHQ